GLGIDTPLARSKRLAFLCIVRDNGRPVLGRCAREPHAECLAEQERDMPDSAVKLKLLRTLTHNNSVYWATISADGKQLPTASLDNTVKIGNAADGRHVGTLKGHGDGVAFVDFLKDGRMATASLDKTLKLWSAEGELKTTFAGHQDYLSCAALARN